MAKIDVDAMELPQKITIVLHLKRARELQIRVWIATKIMLLASLIGGFGFRIDSEVDNG